MNRTRRLGLAFGVVLVVYGLAVVFAPGLARGFASPPGLLIAVGVAAFLGVVAAVRTRLTTDTAEIELPTPERRRTPPTPGDEFDTLLDALGPSRRVRDARERRAVRDRLDELAVAVLVRDGDTEATARERLATGTWTTDPDAAAFFAEERAATLSLEHRLRAAFSTEPSSKRRARHAVDALARIAETERGR